MNRYNRKITTIANYFSEISEVTANFDCQNSTEILLIRFDVFNDFSIKVLADDVVLATYVSHRHNPDEDPKHALRSSIWKLMDGRWKIVFHQGTPIRIK